MQNTRDCWPIAKPMTYLACGCRFIDDKAGIRSAAFFTSYVQL